MEKENFSKNIRGDLWLLTILVLLSGGFYFLRNYSPLFERSAEAILADSVQVGSETLADLKSLSANFDFKGQVPLYMISSKICHYCDIARADIQKAGWKVYEVYVESSQEAGRLYRKISQLSGTMGTPQLIAGDRLFVGYQREQIVAVPGFSL